ncbi:MFS transporter [Photobacterium phosphoreum]|uniref:MFS transporter n=1 Tax=Photobacterium phosphoreum TaxID=659 RepID=UPI0023D902BB|nr:MFS transporter [Photobacterium phosphoreum]
MFLVLRPYSKIPSSSLYEFVAARSRQGVGGGACYIAALSTVRRMCDDEGVRVATYARLHGVSCSVSVIDPSFGAILIVFDWEAIFLVMALFSIIMCCFALFMNIKISPPKSVVSDRVSYLQSDFLTMAVASSISLGVIFVYVSVSLVILMLRYNLSVREYALWMELFAILSVVTSFCLPTIRKYFNDRGLLLISLVTLSVCGVALSVNEFNKNVEIFLVVLGVIGVCNATVFTLTLGKTLTNLH